MTTKYAIVGQGWIADGVGTTDSVRRLVPGVNNINITGAGTLTVTMCSGTSAVAESDVATVTGSPVSCPQAAATVITVVGTGNIKITVTYGSAALTDSIYTWSLSSGGVTGAAVPGSTDNVIADANTFTATGQTLSNSGLVCAAMNWTGALYNPTLALGGNLLQTNGNVTLISAMTITRSAGGDLDMRGTGTLITNGLTLATSVRINGNITLGDALSIISTQGVYIGIVLDTAFTSANYAITAGFFKFDYGAQVKTLTLGSSVINVTGAAGFIGTATQTTITANTATINLSGTAVLSGGAVNYNGSTFNLNGTAHTVSGAFTCAAIGFGPAGAQTITWTDSTTYTATTWSRTGTGRIKFQGSGANGYTLAKAGGGVVNLELVDWTYAIGSPGSTWYAGPNCRDLGNNNSIYFNWSHKSNMAQKVGLI